MRRLNEEPEVTVIETDSGSGVRWFLLGALVGAAAGLLFAPQDGRADPARHRPACQAAS